MVTVPIQIVRFVMEHQPNIVECVLTDASGRRWHFLDKSAIFTEVYLDRRSAYPLPGILGCEVVREWTDERGRSIATIDTDRPWAISATTGETRFDVLADQITTDAA
jgi:hypothetical protein